MAGLMSSLKEIFFPRDLSVQKTKWLRKVKRQLAPLRVQGRTAQVLINFDAERHLDSAVWHELSAHLATLPKAARKSAEELEIAATQVFQKHVLQGPEVPRDRDRLYGNAMRKERIEELLQDSRCLPPASVKVLLRGKFDHARFVANFSDILDTPLNRHAMMWATFNERLPHSDPFADLAPCTTARVTCYLGLSPYKREMLLLSYNLNGANRPRKPTVADACACKPWNASFRPESDRRFGYTMPKERKGLEDAFRKPEVVHKPILWRDVEQAAWSIPS